MSTGIGHQGQRLDIGAGSASSPIAASGTSNIARHLPALAMNLPYGLAVAAPEGRDGRGRIRSTQLSFQRLDQESDILARGLRAHGIDRGTRVVLMVKPSLPFFELIFALFKLGAVPVVVDPGMGARNLGTCLAEASPEAFIGIPKAQLARVLLRWGSASIKTIVSVGPRLLWGGLSLEDLRQAGATGEPVLVEASRDETAAILFTSGSTGVPKGAIYSHGNFSAQVDILRRVYDIRPGESDLATFPLFGLFGPALGMATIIPNMDASKPAKADPQLLVEAIEHWGCSNMFGSPALLRNLGRYGAETGQRLPSLRRVICAGAPVPSQVLEQVQAMLSEGVEIHTPYGATESLPVASIGSRSILDETRQATAKGRGICVGRPVDEAIVRVIGIDDEPIARWSDELCIPDGEVGEIVVKGPMVTRSYFNRESSTALAKISDGEEVRHRMGDLGRFDEQGRLWFYGRKAHRLETAKGRWFTIAVEAIFNEHPAIFRSALVGLGEPGAERPVLCVELETGAPPWAALAKELRAIALEHEHTKELELFLCHPGLPVDVRHNAKIVREALRGWVAERIR